MKRLHFLSEVSAELEDAMKWYEEQSAGLGRELRIAVEQTCNLIEDYPRLGSPYEDTVLRRLVTRRFPYVIYYLERQEDVLVIAIAHAKRRPDYWKRRLKGLP